MSVSQSVNLRSRSLAGYGLDSETRPSLRIRKSVYLKRIRPNAAHRRVRVALRASVFIRQAVTSNPRSINKILRLSLPAAFSRYSDNLSSVRTKHHTHEQDASFLSKLPRRA